MRALRWYNQEQQYPVGPWPGTDSFRGSRSLHFVDKTSAEKISAGMFSMIFAKTMPHKKKATNYYVPRKCKFYIFRYPCPHDLGKRNLHWSSFFPQPGLPVGVISLLESSKTESMNPNAPTQAASAWVFSTTHRTRHDVKRYIGHTSKDLIQCLQCQSELNHQDAFHIKRRQFIGTERPESRHRRTGWQHCNRSSAQLHCRNLWRT